MRWPMPRWISRERSSQRGTTLNRDSSPRRGSWPCGCTSTRTSATPASLRRRSPRRTPSRSAPCTACSSPATTASARSFASAGSTAAAPISCAARTSRSPRSPSDGASATCRSSAACSVSATACLRASCRRPHARPRARRGARPRAVGRLSHLRQALDPALDPPDLPLEELLVAEGVRQQGGPLDRGQERHGDTAWVALLELPELTLGPVEDGPQRPRGVGAEFRVVLVELVGEPAERTAVLDDQRPVARPRLGQSLEPGYRRRACVQPREQPEDLLHLRRDHGVDQLVAGLE